MLGGVKAVLVAGAAVAIGAAGASADTNTSVQTRLARAEPGALYPTQLPERLQNADVTLSRHGHLYSVLWDRGIRNGRPRGYVSLSRNQSGALHEALTVSRRRGFHPRKVTVGTRRVWFLCGHICGYEFVSGQYAYGVFGFYYNPHDRRDLRDMRFVLKALQPLGASA